MRELIPQRALDPTPPSSKLARLSLLALLSLSAALASSASPLAGGSSSPLPSSRAAAPATRLYTEISQKAIQGLLSGLASYQPRFHKSGRPYYQLYFLRTTAFLDFKACNHQTWNCGMLYLSVTLLMHKPVQWPAINDWNGSVAWNDRHFSYAYLLSDGDPVLFSKLDLRGGVTAQAIENSISRFEIDVVRFEGAVDTNYRGSAP